MARQSKDAQIKQLQEDLQLAYKRLSELDEKNHRLIEQANKGFANSSYRFELEEERDFFKRFADLELKKYTKQGIDEFVSDEVLRLQELVGKYRLQLEENGINEHNIEHYENLLRERDEEIAQLKKQIEDLKNKQDCQKAVVETDISIIEHNIEQIERKAGRPPKITSDTVNFIVQLYKKGYSVRKIASQLKISVGTVHRYIKLYENN